MLVDGGGGCLQRRGSPAGGGGGAFRLSDPRLGAGTRSAQRGNQHSPLSSPGRSSPPGGRTPALVQ